MNLASECSRIALFSLETWFSIQKIKKIIIRHFHDFFFIFYFLFARKLKNRQIDTWNFFYLFLPDMNQIIISRENEAILEHSDAKFMI